MCILDYGKWKNSNEFILNEEPKDWGEFKKIADKIKIITFSNKIKSIWQGAFKDFEELVLINAPNVTKIEKSAFKNCKKLRLMDAPNVTVIEDSAFEGCESLWRIDCPEVTSIEKNASKGCNRLEEINFPKVTSIGEGAFDWTNLIKIILPELENLPRDFYPKNAIEVDLSSIKSLGNIKFNNCIALKEIDISGVTSIGDGTFEKCIFLKNINLPNAKSIGEKAFSGCTDLEEITLPNVTTVGENAFWGCTSLKKVHATKLERVAYNSFPDGLIEEMKESNKNSRLKIDENVKKVNAKDSKFTGGMEKISSDGKLYPSGEPTIEDVKQGKIGDCWLLAVLSSLVRTGEGKQIIKDCLREEKNGNVYVTLYNVATVFDPKKKNKLIAYPIGKKEIELDKKSVFSNSNTNAALWVKMIEKAFAASGIKNKYLTSGFSAEEINGGNMNIALTAMTGRIYKSKKIEKNKSQKEKDAYIEKLFNQIAKRLDNGSYVSAGALFEKDGKVEGHAYSVLNVGEGINGKYIVLRNPHGLDSRGNECNEKIKSKIIEEDHKNGIFTLNFEDFVELFDKIDSERLKKGILP